MAADFFEIVGSSGQLLKFAVDRDTVTNVLTLSVTGITSGGGGGGGSTEFPSSFAVNNFPAIQNTSFNGIAQPVTINNAAVTVQGSLGWYPNRQNQTGTTAVIKASAGRIRAFKVENLNNTGATRFLWLFDRSTFATAGLSTGAIDCFTIPPNTVIAVGSEYFSNDGIGFNNGLTFGWSSSRSNYSVGLADLDASFVII